MLDRESRPHDRERVLRHGRRVITAQTRTDAVIERRLDRGRALAHGHLGLRRERDVTAGVLDQSPGFVVEMRTVDVFVARS